MAIAIGNSTRYESCCFTLAVERYDAQDMVCIVYVKNLEQGICCRSFIELARQMELGFVEMNYPTPSVQKRKFSTWRTAGTGERQAEGRVVSGRRDGRLGTFRIRVKQCFHATWQGQVSQSDGGKEGTKFESFLEFVYIMDGMFTGSRSLLPTGVRLSDGLADAILLGGRHGGIWVWEMGSSEVLICGRNLEGGGRDTFVVRPMFRENHTYQGILSWSEGRQKKNFRSFLELLFLIVSATGKPVMKEEDT